MAYYKNKELLEDAHKPKSPDSETITYLCQIEGVLDSHSKSVAVAAAAAASGGRSSKSRVDDEEDDDEDMETEEERKEMLDLLVNNVHDEIAGQQAGLAIDKSASMIMEKLLALSTPAQLRQFGASMRGYFLFLSSHRFGSHVLQKFLSLAPTAVEADHQLQKTASNSTTQQNDAEDGEADGPPITMEAVLCDLCDEVGHKWTSLAKDLCGTHVLRTMLQTLTGRIGKSQSKRTGKGGKRKGRKKKGVAEYDERYFNNMANAIPTCEYEVPASWSQKLVSIVSSVSSKAPKELYDLTFDSNASPVLQLMMTLGSSNEEETDILIRRILDWDELIAYEQRCAEKRAVSEREGTELETFRSWVDDMIRDTCSSHVLEVMLQSASNSLMTDLLNRIFSGHIATYARLPISNFVVQQLLTCVRSPEQLERVMSELKHSMSDLITPRLLGVIWRMVEATNVHNTGQERVIRWLVRASKKKTHKDVVSTLLWAPPKRTTEEEGNSGGMGMDQTPDPHSAIPTWKQKQRANGNSSSGGGAGAGVSGTVSDSGSDLCLNIAGARTLQQLLLGSPKHNTAILSSFARQSASQLVHLGLHPVGSRGVLEVLLQGPDDYDRAKQHLVDRLMGQWTKLSTDRFGTYVVQKCYDVARMQRREAMVSEMANNVRTLSGNNYGRHVMRSCRVELFERNPEQWRSTIKGAERRKQMFENTFGADEKMEDVKESKKRSGTGEDGESDNESEPAKKKRKRKRKKKKKEAEDEEE